MSTAATGLPAPSGPPAAAPVPARGPENPQRRWLPWLLLAVVAGAGYGYWQWQQPRREEARQAAQAAVRTATASSGALTQTLRLTGVTGAERFVSLVTPQLRASRSGRNRDGGQTQMASTTSLPSLSSGRGQGRSSVANANRSAGATGTANASGGDASPSVASSAAAVSGQQGGGGSGTGFSAPTGSSAFRSATSRIGTQRPVAAPPRRTGGSSSATLGSDGLGSTSRELQGGVMGGGGGGGGGEFMLILQDLVKPGSRVRKGDVVAEFDRQFMLLRIEDYKSSVAQQQASLNKLRADLDEYRVSHAQMIDAAKAQLEKARLDVRTIPVLSDIDAERTRLALAEAEAQYKQLLSEVKQVETSQTAQIRNAEYELKAAQLELRRAEQNAERMVSRAAIDGMTVMQNMWRGGDFSQIQQGDQVYPGQLFMQIVDPASMVVNASLNQVDAERLRLGAKATVRFDAYPGLELPAHVIAIAAVTRTGGFRANYVKEVPVRLKLDAMDPRVIPDLSVSVDVVVAEEQAVATVPLGALFADASTAKPFAFVREGTAWRRREVEVGLKSNVAAAIRSGLRPGETIALERPPEAMEKAGS